MKHLFVFLVGLLFILPVQAQNRIASIADKAIYGDYISPGDLIIDTPTRIGENKREVVYYFMPKEWPMLRENATLWLDGDKLGPLTQIKFCNTSKSLTPWHIKSARVKNIPHTRVVSEAFTCQGLKHFELDGESAAYPGLSAWPASRKFLTGAFGFHVIGSLTGVHAYSITVTDGGTIRMNGFEAQHAFSGVRINGGKEDIFVESIEISNFYIHDTTTGEGQYLGATFKPPLARLRNLQVHHGVLARTAAEALQFQHLAGGANIHHVTIYAADVRWMNEFMAGQDTGIQWVINAGENKLHHVIVDGYGSIGLMPFGSEMIGQPGVSKVSKVLFNDGRDSGMYLHKSTSFGIKWFFDSIFFTGITSTYYEQTGRKNRDYYISRKNGTDQMTFRNIFHDGSKSKVFEDTTGISFRSIVTRKFPRPAYINSGFHEQAHHIMQWHPFYAPYFPVSRRDTVKLQVPTKWSAGDIAIETVGEYSFYKCIRSHIADHRRPGEHPFFVKLTWDANGVRSDQRAWDSSLAQSIFPPDDLRLQNNNYWKKLGLGFQEEFLIDFLASKASRE